MRSPLPRPLAAWVLSSTLVLVALPLHAQQAVLVPTENVRVEYGQVLRAEPSYGFLVGKIREVLSSYIHERIRRRPMILSVVTEV